MTALVRRMGALFIQSRVQLLRYSTATPAVKEKEEKEKKKKTRQNYTNVEGLKQFFDEENFFEDRVKTGRSWKLDELRIKSNSDLHKLWFVLYKEYNMLLTLEQAAREQGEMMPNEERIDRVQISMENLEFVVRERNKAYYDLEVGETGEQPVYACLNWMGLATRRTATPHVMPQRYNKTFNERNPLPYNDRYQKWFLNHYRELRTKEKNRMRNRNRRHVQKLLRRNPGADVGALQERYPDVDVGSVKNKLKDRGEV